MDNFEKTMKIIFSGTDDVSKTMATERVDAAQSREISISALKGFPALASDAARSLDILNEVANKYATALEQLA